MKTIIRATLVLSTAFALLAAPLAARADDHGDTPATATVVKVGSITNGVIETAVDGDYFRFSVPVAGTYVFFTRGKTNTVGDLYNTEKELVAHRVGGGELGNFRLERALGQGIYYIKVSGTPNVAGYAIHIEGPGYGTFSDDHGMSPWSATSVALGRGVPGVLDMQGDIDYFRFTVPVGGGGTYSIYTSGGTNTIGELYNASLLLVEASEGGGEINNFRIDRSLAPGTYYVKVYGISTIAGYVFHVDGPVAAAPTAYDGLFWHSPAGSQPGWGVNFAHQGDTLFATWYTFGADGLPLWVVVAANRTAPGVYSGTLYTGTGPAFSVLPFDPAKVVATAVGTATFTFSDENNATFAYTLYGISQVKSITRQLFGSPRPACVWGGQAVPGLPPNYQGIWWAAPAGSEPGWGVNFNHQGNTVFVAWFTFGADGKPLWMVAAAELIAPNTYSGTLYSGTGPAYSVARYETSDVLPVRMGGVTITFGDDGNATFASIANGFEQTRTITRQVFAAPGTICQ